MARKNEPVSVYFVVVGQGEFPYDMLRYDRCFPWLERSSHEMSHSHEQRRVVRLESPNRERHWRPNEERWKSMGWTVKNISTFRPSQDDIESHEALVQHVGQLSEVTK